MVLTRAFDAKAIALQRTGRLGTYASSLGQEAVGVGVAAAMRPEDVLLPSFREHGAQLRRGVKLEELFLYWGGDERGNDFSGPRERILRTVFRWGRTPRTRLVWLWHFGCAARSASQSACSGTARPRREMLPKPSIWPASGSCLSSSLCATTGGRYRCGLTADEGSDACTESYCAGIPGEQVDGNDVIAVRWAVENALARARA